MMEIVSMEMDAARPALLKMDGCAISTYLGTLIAIQSAEMARLEETRNAMTLTLTTAMVARVSAKLRQAGLAPAHPQHAPLSVVTNSLSA
jgi:hypothetical protein